MKSCFSATLFGLGLVTSAFGLTVNTPIAEAKENARAMCLARAGVTDQQWRGDKVFRERFFTIRPDRKLDGRRYDASAAVEALRAVIC